MATGVNVWSKTAATNNTADSAVNWQEGQAPSSVNDSARGMMAATAKWRDDLNGSIATTGTSTAYAATSNQGFAALAANLEITCQFDEDCGATVTLNVDGLGAKPLRSAAGVELVAGAIKAGSVHRATYFTSNSGEWLLHDVNPTIIAADQVVTASIVNDAVTYAKIQNVSATSRVLGRKTASAGDVEECSLSDVLDMVGSAADGDILYRNSGSWTRLAKGTNGQILKLAAGAPSWVDQIISAEYTSSDLTISSAATATLTHGLGAAPKFVQLFLVCQTAEAGYSINDVVCYGNTGTFASATSGISITVTSTSVIYRITDNTLWLTHKTSGTSSNLTLANWKLRVKAFA